MTPDLVAVRALFRLLHDIASMLVWGGFGYLWVLVPAELADVLGRRLEPMRVGAIVVAIATVWLRLPLEAAAVGSGWGDAVNPQIVWPLLTQTNIGGGWLVEAIAAGLLMATLPLQPPRRYGATTVAAGLLLACLSLSGHAQMKSGPEAALLEASEMLHVLAAGAWLGALLPLIGVLRRIGPGEHEAELVALRRFSAAGHFAVTLTIGTGIVNSGLIVGGLPSDWAVPYQAMLSAKIALVAIMIGLASRNRYVYMPLIGGAHPGAAGAIRKGAITELALGAAVLGLVATFGLLDPG